MRYSANERRNSGKQPSDSTAAMMTPKVLPIPPRMTMTTISMDLHEVEPSGSMKA